MKKSKWYKYYLCNFQRSACAKLKLNKQALPIKYKKDFISIDEANEYVIELIQSGKPFVMGRLGETEARSTADALGIKYGCKKNPEKKRLDTLFNNAGVFPYGKEMELRFAEYMETILPDVDILGVWPSFMQDFLVNEYTKDDVVFTRLKSLEPYYAKAPWSKALKGKKVLVIHPFESSIIHQYEIHNELFENKEMLPDFELKTLKAVQTIAGQGSEFKDWFEALDYMYEEAMKIDFDIAILGCGAYGLPLAVRLKRAGKQAIHMGGSTQILFGIKGARWDNHPFISKLYNDKWIRPLPEEKPKGAKNVEGGCYW